MTTDEGARQFLGRSARGTARACQGFIRRKGYFYLQLAVISGANLLTVSYNFDE